MRPVSIVPLQKVTGEAVDLRDAGEQPDETEDRLLEGAEHALDAAIGPRVSGADEGMDDAA